ncbi:MAG TPA: glutamate--tRNA ligase [Vicinamibacterales bacterium]|nr:glutamate--tRNA ligase [Vicinamibacterales bacterium]
MAPPRVRFAPSPTGYLHVGGARTALFNWLFARRHGGTFILRIEDTDTERSSDDMVAGILDSMHWLGIEWDEGPEIGGPHAPYFQTERFERHRALAQTLLADGHAYKCYCAPELLKQKREEAEKAGGGWKYDRTCLQLSAEDQQRLDSSGVQPAVRFKVPPGQTKYTDRVRGTIEFDHEQIEDFVILRSNGLPTYHLSVVADDLDMQITHVIRGDDHISNTPKHILLWRAFGETPPDFAHIPLILGTDKKRLSKRHGATSVTEYERLGYLPEAMVNFLGLLGWSPGGDREVMSRDELVAAFTLDGISGGDAVFNPEKLDWFNGRYLAQLTPEDLVSRVQPLLEAAGVWNEEYAAARREWLQRVLQLVLPRVRRLPDFVEQARPFLAGAVDYEPEAVRKHLTQADLDKHIEALIAALEKDADPFDEPTIEHVLRGVADVRGIKAATLIHAARIAATGKAVSPGIFEVLALLGKPLTLARLHDLVTYLRNLELP